MKLDIDGLTACVTEALYASVRPDGEGWDDLSPDDKAAFEQSAVAAILAQTKWYQDNGVQVLSPGTFKRPECREEAQAMATAAMMYLKDHPAKPALAGSLGLIKPSRHAL